MYCSDYLWVRAQELAGQRIAQPFANNGDLVANALDNLAGSDDLISIRGRAAFQRPFARVEALRARADDRFRDKEQELEKQLHATEDQLAALQSQRSDRGVAILTPDQEQALTRFQAEKLRIRKELRDVRLGLDQDITRLGNWLKVINIILAPRRFAVLTVLIGLLLRLRAGTGSADDSPRSGPVIGRGRRRPRRRGRMAALPARRRQRPGGTRPGAATEAGRPQCRDATADLQGRRQSHDTDAHRDPLGGHGARLSGRHRTGAQTAAGSCRLAD